jgi:iron(III) transport system permease protein
VSPELHSRGPGHRLTAPSVVADASSKRVPVEQLVLGFVLAAAVLLVAYPMFFLLQLALNVGKPDAHPITAYGLRNFAAVFGHLDWIGNTLLVSTMGTIGALVLGLVLAWIVTRTNVPGARLFEQLIVLPYYVSPLVGALAWSVLATPRGGLINKLWQNLAGPTAVLVDIQTPGGIAWVMALYDGTVAFMIIAAAMRTMDPSLEECSMVLGGGRLWTALRVTVPLLKPAILGAAMFVFAEMLGSFAIAAVLGTPARFFVVTTGLLLLLGESPPNYPLAAALGISLFIFTGAAMWLYLRSIGRGNFTTITGKGFRPRTIDMRGWRPALFGICLLYVFLAAILPLSALLLTSFLTFNTTTISQMVWTLDNFRQVFSPGPTFGALRNSFFVAFVTASIGVVFVSLISWFIYRSAARGRSFLEYVVMFPQAVPKMVFSLGLLWAWIVMPVGIYGTLWLLILAYLTIFLPLGVRTISGVILQLEKSIEECARVCGATWMTTLRTITLPLLKPGVLAAWVLLFIVSVREVSASILLISANTKVIGPAIIQSYEESGLQLTAAMAITLSSIVFVALAVIQRIAGDDAEPKKAS